MSLTRFSPGGVAMILLAAALVMASVAMAGDSVLQRNSTLAYYSVVADRPYAAYTAASGFVRTSTFAHYSVIAEQTYAPYTDTLQRTSILPYYSVLH